MCPVKIDIFCITNSAEHSRAYAIESLNLNPYVAFLRCFLRFLSIDTQYISYNARSFMKPEQKRFRGLFLSSSASLCFHVGRSRPDLGFCQFSTQFSFWRRNKPCDSNHQTQSTKPRREPSITSLDVCTVIICLLILGVTEKGFYSLVGATSNSSGFVTQAGF